jgi:hypothetical protein
MPTGAKHQRFIIEEYNEEGQATGYLEDCRCMIGEDHDSDGSTDEGLSVDDAALIWLSNGMDADYAFGYNESELRRALDRS